MRGTVRLKSAKHETRVRVWLLKYSYIPQSPENIKQNKKVKQKCSASRTDNISSRAETDFLTE